MLRHRIICVRSAQRGTVRRRDGISTATILTVVMNMRTDTVMEAVIRPGPVRKSSVKRQGIIFMMEDTTAAMSMRADTVTARATASQSVRWMDARRRGVIPTTVQHTAVMIMRTDIATDPVRCRKVQEEEDVEDMEEGMAATEKCAVERKEPALPDWMKECQRSMRDK